MNIPADLLSKMSTYEVEIHGVKVKAHLLDRTDSINSHVSAMLQSILEKRIVALDVKTEDERGQLLILCAGAECLVIQLNYLQSYPSNLERLFYQESVCFVGVGIIDILKYLAGYIGSGCKNAVELGYLAARVLKNPDLIQEPGLQTLAEATGVTLQQSTLPDTKIPAWSARVFSAEQIKLAIHDACTAYLIGAKLLEKI